MYKSRDLIIFFSLLYNGDWTKVYNAIIDKEEPEWEKYAEFPNELKNNCITILDYDIYPVSLLRIYHPPFVLFYKGDIDILKKEKRVAIIGTRRPTDYGLSATKMIADSLMDKYVIVSGMALGIDGEAQRQGMINGAKTISVLGTGINEVYPIDNKDIYDEAIINHLVLSEYPFDVHYKPENFPIRNRIIAGLSDAIIIPEAYTKSGTSTTVKLALMDGKDILCVPHQAGLDTLNNRLIADGAYLIDNKDDILDILDKVTVH